MTSNTNMISILCFAAMLTAFVSCTEDEKDDTQIRQKSFYKFCCGLRQHNPHSAH